MRSSTPTGAMTTIPLAGTVRAGAAGPSAASVPLYARPMRILITGAARAIGRATAEELLARGHDVVATARDPELLADLDGARTHALDVTDAASVTGVPRPPSASSTPS